MLADVADLRSQGVAELMLYGEVPLLTHRGLEILISDPDPASRIAGLVYGRDNSWEAQSRPLHLQPL